MNINDIINKYEKFIKSQIYLLDRDINVINEIYQTVLIRLWKKAPETVNFKYLSKLIRNTFIDNYRSNKKHFNYIPIDEAFLIDAFDLSNVKEDAMIKDLQLHTLLQKIDKLKESQRDVVLLRLKGYSFIDIAKIMNTSQNTALGRIYYAKKQLSKKNIL